MRAVCDLLKRGGRTTAAGIERARVITHTQTW
jgi:hypothetical protein